MARGDHYEVSRPGFRHHGIDIGDGTVVHFTGEPMRKPAAKVERTSWASFIRGNSYRVVQYDGPTWTPDHVCLRALREVGMTGYNLMKRNCEHFATFCKTGEWRSVQVNSSLKRVVDVSRRGAMMPSMFLAGPAFELGRRLTMAAGHLVRQTFQQPSPPPQHQTLLCSYFHYGELLQSPGTATAMFAASYGQLYRLQDGALIPAFPDDTVHVGSLYVDDQLMIYSSQPDGWYRFAPGDNRLKFAGGTFISGSESYILDASDGNWKKSLSGLPVTPPDHAELFAFVYVDAIGRIFLHQKDGWYIEQSNQWIPAPPFRTDLRFI